MIECKPVGISSWNYILTTEGHSAKLGFGRYGETGFAEVDGASFKISEYGRLSWHWTMADEQGPLFSALKRPTVIPSIEITTGVGVASLRPAGWSRAKILTSDDLEVLIETVNDQTRKARIIGHIPDFRFAAFAFWLVVILWRRGPDPGDY